MNTTWRIISVLSIIIIILGVVCIAVGLFTGGSMERINQALYSSYNVDFYKNLGNQLVNAIFH